jgi:peptidoglycan/LPS O-acetylase OafA/YrhL
LVEITDFPLWTPVWDDHLWKRLAYFFVFSPQLLIPLKLMSGASFAGVLWSIGVEEHFYFFWPWLMRASRAKVVIPAFGIILLTLALGSDTANSYLGPLVKEYGEYIRIENFSPMAIGALGGWLVHTKSRWLKFLWPRFVQWLILGLLGFAMIFSQGRLLLYPSLSGALFLGVILIVAISPNPVLRLDHPALEKLGEYSYSFYCFHWMMIALVMNALASSGMLVDSMLLQVIAYGAPFLMTILLSALCYRFVEKPALRLKSAFAVVPSASLGLESALDSLEQRANLQAR